MSPLFHSSFWSRIRVMVYVFPTVSADPSEAGFTVFTVRVSIFPVKGITSLFIRYSVSPTKMRATNCFSTRLPVTLKPVTSLSITIS